MWPLLVVWLVPCDCHSSVNFYVTASSSVTGVMWLSVVVGMFSLTVSSIDCFYLLDKCNTLAVWHVTGDMWLSVVVWLCDSVIWPPVVRWWCHLAVSSSVTGAMWLSVAVWWCHVTASCDWLQVVVVQNVTHVFIMWHVVVMHECVNAGADVWTFWTEGDRYLAITYSQHQYPWHPETITCPLVFFSSVCMLVSEIIGKTTI